MNETNPNMTNNNNATLRTLHLPELLEQILSHLPQRDLLLAQRTSRAFHQTINSSPKLQRALFLSPDPHLPASPITYLNPSTGTTSAHRKPKNNSLLLRAFPGIYPTVSPVLCNLPPSREDVVHGRPGPEVWRWDVCISFPAGGGGGRSAAAGGAATTTTESGQIASTPPTTNPATAHPTASWRRMYLSQPPCTALHLVRRWRRCRRKAVERAGGITMGDFVDEVTAKGALIAGGDDDGSGWSEGLIASDRDWHFEGTVGGEGNGQVVG
jgi:hypothetical protein